MRLLGAKNIDELGKQHVRLHGPGCLAWYLGLRELINMFV